MNQSHPEWASAWEFVRAGGLAAALFGILYLILRGVVITKGHHNAVTEELRNLIVALTEDRNEWRAHASTLSGAIDRLSDIIRERGRR